VRRLGVLAAVAALVTGGAAAAPLPRVLMVTVSAGYEHDVVRRPAADRLSLAESVVDELGRRSGRFEVTHVATGADLARLTPEAVRAHRAVLFFTTGELPMAAGVRDALFHGVADGGGFVGVHSATDTWYAVPEYGALIGARFDGHPWHQAVRIVVEDPAHPATRPLGESFSLSDEIYEFKDVALPQLHVLLRLDPRSVDAARGHRGEPDYVLAWAKHYGRGRVFYTALGHEPAVWRDERFQAHLLGGIAWALGAP
jgi:type 1 glutamine amidotransferase